MAVFREARSGLIKDEALNFLEKFGVYIFFCERLSV